MRTLIINLPQCTDRLQALNSHLSAHPYLKTEVVEAVDGRKLTRQESERLFDIHGFQRCQRRLPRPGEIGCTLSHQKAYVKIAESGVNTLILEDDIHLLRDLRNELEEADAWLSSKTPRILLLGTACLYRGRKSYSYESPLHKRLATPYCYAHGTYAYALNPEAARCLIYNKRRPDFAADAFMLFRKRHKVEIKAMLPPAIMPATEEEAPSLITSRSTERVKYSLADRIHFFLRDKKHRLLTATGILHQLDSIEFRPV